MTYIESVFCSPCLNVSSPWRELAFGCSPLAASSGREEPWGWLDQPPAHEFLLAQSGLEGPVLSWERKGLRRGLLGDTQRERKDEVGAFSVQFLSEPCSSRLISSHLEQEESIPPPLDLSG